MKRLIAAAALLLFVTSLSPRMARGLAPVVVTNTNDNGPGSLRQALLDANSNPDLTTVNFSLGAGPHTIAPLSALPTITQPIVIDGFSQAGSSRNTHPVGQPSNAVILVFISGASAGNATGLHVHADAEIFGLDVSGFTGYGMYLGFGLIVVEGCHIGVSGANAFDGIYVDEADNASRIGGALAGARNVISGNSRSGIAVNKTEGVLIQGNYIGVAPDGTSSLGNADSGIEMLDDARSNTIGGAPASDCAVAPQTSNIIAHNGGDGVLISDIGFVDAEENTIWSNSIHSNGELGIDLSPNGVTLNDFNDVDTGANQRQNYPNVSSAEDTVIKYTLLGKPSTTYTVQFFRSASCDGSGNGEGSVYMSQMNIATNVNGSAGDFMICGPIPPSSVITATATDPQGNTSEFSPCVTSQNTTVGSNRIVGVPDEDGALVANLTFASVTTTGNTFVTPGAVPPEPVPGSFLIGGTPTYYGISTTAVFNTASGVDVCLHYNEAALAGDEDDVLLLHYDSVLGDWVDVTTGRNTTTDFVCGKVSTFSPFVVAVPAGPTSVGDAPRTFALHPNVPNPFNPQTTIQYDIPSDGADVNISIYDVAGRMVRELVDEHRAAGQWSVQWNGDDERGLRVASGVYFYRMRAGSFVETRKMILLK